MRMDEEAARKILKGYIEEDGGLYCLGHYLAWSPGDDDICLDCRFSADELEAIVWWMRNKAGRLSSTEPANGTEGKDG